MTEDADQPPPRDPLLLAQGATHLVEHQQVMREAILPERRMPDVPAPRRAGHLQRHQARLARLQQGLAAEFLGRHPQDARDRPREEAGRGRIGEPQHVPIVEGQHRRLELRHHRRQQRARLDLREALRLQPRGQGVELVQQDAEVVVGDVGARTHREVPLAQALQQRRRRPQRRDDGTTQHVQRVRGPRHDEDEQRERGGAVARGRRAAASSRPGPGRGRSAGVPRASHPPRAASARVRVAACGDTWHFG